MKPRKLSALVLLLLPGVTAGHAAAAVRYVDVNSASPAAPYTTWATAARVIQDAIDAANAGDEVVVTNGVYQTGGVKVAGEMNRVAVTKPLMLRSVDGPGVTVIEGNQDYDDFEPIRCVFLTNNATLSGFTVTRGSATNGGGVWCASASAVVSNCVISRNSVQYVAARGSGGGAFGGTLNHCTLVGNSASDGGGASHSILNNCTLINGCRTKLLENHFHGFFCFEHD